MIIDSNKEKDIKIFVNASSANSRGLLVVLLNFISEIEKSEILFELNVRLVILTPDKELKSDNRNISFIWYKGKKSLFTKFTVNRYIKKYIKTNNISAFLSLQNTGIFNIKIPQFVMIHTLVPFSRHNFREYDFKLYLKYKIFLRLYYKLFISSYTGIFVQTASMKSSIKSMFELKSDIYAIKPNEFSITSCNDPLCSSIQQKLETSYIKLLYVTSNEKYKNNQRLINAVKSLNSEERRIKLFLTLDGIDDDDIVYLNKVNYKSIYNLYKKVDALIFPSLIESLGLPLQEAMQAGIPILAADLPYAHEVCSNNAQYFDPFDINSIKNSIINFVSGSIVPHSKNEKGITKESYTDFIKIIYERLTKQEKLERR